MSNEKYIEAYKKKVDALLIYNKKAAGGDFLVPLNFYLGILEDTDKVMFPYMNAKKKQQLLRDLQVTYLLLLTEAKYELTHQKTENFKIYVGHIKKCQRLIDALNYQQSCTEKHQKPAPELEYASDGKTVAYLGLFFGNLFAKEMVASTDGTSGPESDTKTIIGDMSAVNEKRLYWVWASTLLKTTLELLPPDFFNADQAQKAAKTPDPYTGCMSWALYYFRFSLNLGLLLKHTISGPWMSAEEQNIPWTERFKTQWAQRKFTLLNDSIWATGNLLCYFWLYGKGAAGTWGDMLTIGLLVFDISLAIWDFEEQKTRYLKEMLDYNTQISDLKIEISAAQFNQEKNERAIIALKKQINDDVISKKIEDHKFLIATLRKQIEGAETEDAVKLQIQLDNLEKEQKQYQQGIATYKNQLERLEQEQKQLKQNLNEYPMQLNALERAEKKCQREWDYQKITLATNISYAVGLMLAFVLLASPFFPLAGASILAMTIAGAVLCFAFSVICNAIKGGIEIHKTKMTAKEAREESALRVEQLHQLLVDNPDRDDNEKRLIFLEIKKLRAETKFQEQTITLQTIQLIRSVLFEALIPALVFASLVFMPLGIGLGVLGAVIALAICANLIINHVFKPEKEEVKPFNEEEYQTFCDEVEQSTLSNDSESHDKRQTSSAGFFKAIKEPTHAEIELAKRHNSPDGDDGTLPLLYDDKKSPI